MTYRERRRKSEEGGGRRMFFYRTRPLYLDRNLLPVGLEHSLVNLHRPQLPPQLKPSW